MFFFGPCPNYLPSPQFGQLVPLFLDVKNDVLARITEPSNDDYDNGVSDNCDQNFGTFDDFGVKNDQKVSHNMILMSKYKGQHGGERVTAKDDGHDDDYCKEKGGKGPCPNLFTHFSPPCCPLYFDINIML